MLALSCALESEKQAVSVYNWEANITHIDIEQCDAVVDPLGYCAVFYLEVLEVLEVTTVEVKTFRVGASLLAQREGSVLKAGYKAPMTGEAISRIEERLGFSLR